MTQATYTRDAGGKGQVDVFATSTPFASVTVDATAAFPAWPMTGDGTGKFFAHIPVASLNPVPATITVTADDSANNPANVATTTSLINLTDLVTITAANYTIVPVGSETLTVTAVSSDAFAPLPTLTSSLTGGVLSLVTKAPPSTVTVTSSKGGSDSQKVTVLTPGNEPSPPPIARNDAARTFPDTPVIISVLANDMAPGSTLNPASIVVTQPLAGGTAAADLGAGTITFTPTAGFTGTTTFTYTVNNTLGTPSTSNIATVTVTVAAAPLAVNDGPVTTAPNTPIVINILANDVAAAPTVLNPTTVTIVTAPLLGTTAINPGTGAVTYSSAIAGTDSFTYTVKDNLGTVSNPATVSISVIVPGTPTVVNDFATTTQGQPVAIPVLANDTGFNPITLVVATPPAQGSAVVTNVVTGLITYTPPVAFTGIMTFTYTVRGPTGVVSNPALVTVTVNPLVETITVARAEFNARLRAWTVTGKTTAVSPPNNTMTIRTGSAVGTLLGTAPVDAAGNWALNLASSPVPFNATVSVQSSYGTAVTSAVNLR